MDITETDSGAEVRGARFEGCLGYTAEALSNGGEVEGIVPAGESFAKVFLRGGKAGLFGIGGEAGDGICSDPCFIIAPPCDV